MPNPDCATDDQLRLFYHCVLLVAAICPSQKIRHEDSSRNRKWHRFLNDLCWFCDTDLGGKTVTSIAVSKGDRGLEYWVASNHDQVRASHDKTRSEKHLTWLFDELKQGDSSSPEDRSALTSVILSHSVSISYKKVRNHMRQLEEYLKQALRSPGLEDYSLLQSSLHTIIDKHRFSYADLSRAALEFRKDGSYKVLKSLAIESPAWSLVRHQLGRLGSWAKSARYIVHFASSDGFRQQLEQASIKSVPRPKTYGKPDGTPLADYSSILQCVLPELDATKLDEMFQLCTKDSDADAELRKICENGLKPVLHAELAVMHHFDRNELDFARDDTYVACSKGPCFCCDLYARRHHRLRKFHMRPGHGNAWPKWALLKFHGGTHHKPGLQTQNDSMILGSMIMDMRGLIRMTLMEARVRGRRLPDSTTGITTSRQSIDVER